MAIGTITNNSTENLRSAEEIPEELNNSIVINNASESDKTIDSADSTVVKETAGKYNTLNFALTNARSLTPKLNSMTEAFGSSGLDFAMISETWCTGSKKQRKIIQDYEADTGIEIIGKNRPSRGGGVCIAFRKSSCSFKRFPLPKSKMEVVCAVGCVRGFSKKFAVMSLYIPPKYSAEQLGLLGDYVADALELVIRKHGDVYVCLGGDTNHRDLGQFLGDFPGVTMLQTLPTRNMAALDTCYTNFGEQVCEVESNPPLSSEENSSDHLLVTYKFKIERLHQYQKTEIKVRPIEETGMGIFGQFLAQERWESLRGLSSTRMVEIFDEKMMSAYDAAFPQKTIVVRSCDLPWISKRIRRLVRRRKRMHKRLGSKNQKYREFYKEVEEKINENRCRHLEKVKTSVIGPNRGSRPYHKAIKLLVSNDPSTKKWSPTELFPDKTEGEVAQKGAEFFNAISAEFTPLAKPEAPPELSEEPPLLYEIEAKLRKIKKPKSNLYGDIDPAVVNRFVPLLSIPLQIIYEEVFSTCVWPNSWKKETVTIIPKNSTPSNFGETRNISRTPLFSKLLESFVLDRLRSQLSLARTQFGGLKRVGIDHFLIETWQEILETLEQGGTAVNLMSIDFQKAFNRMDHATCLAQLERKGVSRHLVAIVATFLHDRRMSVTVGSSSSSELPVVGGSPQGSILGPILFCITSELLSEPLEDPPVPLDGREEQEIARPHTPDERVHDEEVSSDSSDEEWANLERFPFFPRRANPLDDTIVSQNVGNDRLNDFLGAPAESPPPPTVKVYIDDFNIIERIPTANSVTHYSQNRPLTTVHADQSESELVRISETAKQINMVVNPLKTQLLCMNGDSAMDVRSFIRHQGSEIKSSDSLKILGFQFGKNPDVSNQVDFLLTKSRSRLWGLRKLKAHGHPNDVCLAYWTCYIRPIIEFSSPTYHSMLTKGQATRIEKLQSRALKITYGVRNEYEENLASSGLKKLCERRERSFEKFAQKTLSNPRFSETWFPVNDSVEHDLRRRLKYKEFYARTERLKNSPMFAMRRCLNRVGE